MKQKGKYAIWIGLLFIVAGFAYDMMFAGIPYQDPPIDLQNEYERNQAIASWIMNSGLIITAAGVIIMLLSKLIQYLKKGN